MATFTSVQNGDWNDGATWGNTSPGVKGTDWPGNSGDLFLVGHNVCYNVSETNPMGSSQVHSLGMLFFSASANTKLTFGDVKFTIGNSATLTIGTSATPIPNSYTAELIWDTSTDNKNGLVAVSDEPGYVSFCGDPATYGSSFVGWMVNTWQGSQTFTMSGDFYNKWLSGQTVIIHKYPDSYNDWDTDIQEFTISSIWNNGGNTSILISEAAPGSNTVFNAGGPIVNMTRNVKVSKLNHLTGPMSLSTNRPYIDFDIPTSSDVFVCHDMVFAGLHHITGNQGLRIKNVVIRNGYYGFDDCNNSQLDDTVIYSQQVGFYASHKNQLNTCIFCCMNYGIYLSYVNIVNSVMIYSNNQGVRTIYDADISGAVFDNNVGLRECSYVRTAVRGFSNNNFYQNCTETHLNNGYIGYDFNMNEKPNVSDFYMSNYNKNYVKCTVVSTPINFLYRNSPDYNGGIYFANFDEIPNNLYIANEFFDLTKNTTVTRSGGATHSLKVSPFDGITSRKHYIIEDWYEYDLNANIEQTRIIYVMGAGWSTFPGSGKLCLEAYYYDQSSGCHCGMSVSTTTLTQNSQWTPLTVTFTPVQSWAVNYQLYFRAYESTSAHIYVDNQIRNEL